MANEDTQIPTATVEDEKTAPSVAPPPKIGKTLDYQIPKYSKRSAKFREAFESQGKGIQASVDSAFKKALNDPINEHKMGGAAVNIKNNAAAMKLQNALKNEISTQALKEAIPTQAIENPFYVYQQNKKQKAASFLLKAAKGPGYFPLGIAKLGGKYLKWVGGNLGDAYDKLPSGPFHGTRTKAASFLKNQISVKENIAKLMAKMPGGFNPNAYAEGVNQYILDVSIPENQKAELERLDGIVAAQKKQIDDFYAKPENIQLVKETFDLGTDDEAKDHASALAEAQKAKLDAEVNEIKQKVASLQEDEHKKLLELQDHMIVERQKLEAQAFFDEKLGVDLGEKGPLSLSTEKPEDRPQAQTYTKNGVKVTLNEKGGLNLEVKFSSIDILKDAAGQYSSKILVSDSKVEAMAEALYQKAKLDAATKGRKTIAPKVTSSDKKLEAKLQKKLDAAIQKKLEKDPIYYLDKDGNKQSVTHSSGKPRTKADIVKLAHKQAIYKQSQDAAISHAQQRKLDSKIGDLGKRGPEASPPKPN